MLGEVDEDAERRARMASFDALPTAVRVAVSECLFDVWIGRRLPPDMDCSNIIAAIKRLKSERDAVEFNEQHAARGFGRRGWRW